MCRGDIRHREREHLDGGREDKIINELHAGALSLVLPITQRLGNSKEAVTYRGKTSMIYMARLLLHSHK